MPAWRQSERKRTRRTPQSDIWKWNWKSTNQNFPRFKCVRYCIAVDGIISSQNVAATFNRIASGGFFWPMRWVSHPCVDGRVSHTIDGKWIIKYRSHDIYIYSMCASISDFDTQNPNHLQLFPTWIHTASAWIFRTKSAYISIGWDKIRCERFSGTYTQHTVLCIHSVGIACNRWCTNTHTKSVSVVPSDDMGEWKWNGDAYRDDVEGEQSQLNTFNHVMSSVTYVFMTNIRVWMSVICDGVRARCACMTFSPVYDTHMNVMGGDGAIKSHLRWRQYQFGKENCRQQIRTHRTRRPPAIKVNTRIEAIRNQIGIKRDVQIKCCIIFCASQIYSSKGFAHFPARTQNLLPNFTLGMWMTSSHRHHLSNFSISHHERNSPLVIHKRTANSLLYWLIIATIGWQ